MMAICQIHNMQSQTVKSNQKQTNCEKVCDPSCENRCEIQDGSQEKAVMVD